MDIMKLVAVILNALWSVVLTSTSDEEILEISMPGFQAVQDSYVCTSISLDNGDSGDVYLREISPFGNLDSIHHLQLAKCGKPGYTLIEELVNNLQLNNEQPVWSCAFHNPSANLPYADRCAKDSKLSLLYATALHAPKFTLPNGVGIKLPKNQHLVMQIHYNRTLNERDYSGLKLKVSNSVERYAGVSNFFLTAHAPIFPYTRVNVDMLCDVDISEPVLPIAYMVHTHEHGRMVYAYSIDKDKNWSLIAKRDPRLSQNLEMISDATRQISPGDKIGIRCSIDNWSGLFVWLGMTHLDEMCNFVLIFSSQNADTTEKAFTCRPEELVSWHEHYDNVPPEADYWNKGS